MDELFNLFIGFIPSPSVEVCLGSPGVTGSNLRTHDIFSVLEEGPFMLSAVNLSSEPRPRRVKQVLRANTAVHLNPDGVVLDRMEPLFSGTERFIACCKK